jgi:tRNA (guanine37-N1)-methyltransferase
VVSGGETPALLVIDAVSRLVPGVVGDRESVEQDSFAQGILDYPHYTRPAEFEGGAYRTCCSRGITRRCGGGG